MDMDNRMVWVRNGSGQWNGSGTANPATNTGGISLATVLDGTTVMPFASTGDALFPFLYSKNGAGPTGLSAFSSFAFTPPSGFGAL